MRLFETTAIRKLGYMVREAQLAHSIYCSPFFPDWIVLVFDRQHGGNKKVKDNRMVEAPSGLPRSTSHRKHWLKRNISVLGNQRYYVVFESAGVISTRSIRSLGYLFNQGQPLETIN